MTCNLRIYLSASSYVSSSDEDEESVEYLGRKCHSHRYLMLSKVGIATFNLYNDDFTKKTTVSPCCPC